MTPINLTHAPVLVVGAGIMGAGIAQVAAQAGHAVMLFDTREGAAAEAKLKLSATLTVGDGANDLPMLGLAGLGVAFRAKPLVKQSAKQAISTLGLDGILYLLGFRDREGQD